MSTIADIRQQYPQYNDMSDQQLADALHKKYYSDLPKEKVYQKLGINSVAANQAPQSPQVSNPGSQHPSSNQLINSVDDNSFTKGLSDAVSNLPINFINMITENNPGRDPVTLQPLSPKKIPQFKTGEGAGYKTGSFTGDIASYLLGGEALKSSSLARALAGGGLKGAAGNALGSGAYGAIQSPDNRALGALLGGATSGLIDAPGALISGLKGSVSPQELQQNFDITKGTNTPLGDVVNNPKVKRFYDNFLAHIPFNGSTSQTNKASSQVSKKGEEIFSNLLGDNDPNDLKIQLQQALKKSSNEADQASRDKALQLNEFANSLGLKVGRSNFSSEAKGILDDINKSPELKAEMSGSMVNDLKRYANPSNQNNLKLSNIFKGKIGDKASEHYVNDRTYEYGVYKRLKDSLQKDIDESISSSKNPELKNKYGEYMDFYRNNVVPFKEPEVQKFIKQGGDPDLILSTFIKTGKNDRGNLTNKLMSKLPDDKKGIVPYAYLSKAIEDNKLNPMKARTLYKNLGERQKNALLNPADKKSLDDWVKLVGMNSESLTSMVNPKNGFRNMTPLTNLLHAATTAGGGLEGGLGGLIGGAVAPTAGSIPIVQALTNPAFRDRLVKAMINQSKNQGKQGFTKKAIRSTAVPLATQLTQGGQ